MRKKARKPRAGYAVGYGRLPISSRFQPGQSGNPQGRPKGVRNASSMARDALERTINVKVKGTWRNQHPLPINAANFGPAESSLASCCASLSAREKEQLTLR